MKQKILPDRMIVSIANLAGNIENQRLILDIPQWLEEERIGTIIAQYVELDDSIKYMSSKWFIPEIIERIVWCIFSLYLKFELRIRIP